MSVSSAEPDGVRMCRDRGILKPLTDFRVSPKRKGGRGSYCKDCFNVRSRRSYAKRVAEKYGRQVREALVIPDGHRHCPDCDEIKPLEDFPKSKSGRGPHGGYCKPCHNVRGKVSIARRGGSREYHLRRRYGTGRTSSTSSSPSKGASVRSVVRPTPNTSITIIAPGGCAGYCASTATAVSGSSVTTRSTSPAQSRT